MVLIRVACDNLTFPAIRAGVTTGQACVASLSASMIPCFLCKHLQSYLYLRETRFKKGDYSESLVGE